MVNLQVAVVKMYSKMITIVVCTYNRSKLLASVLRTLCSQRVDRSCFEILVIDNNSKDDTFLVVQEFSEKYSNVRYHLERKQGLSHARNQGWKLSKGEYVGYIDDDTKVPEQWVGVAIEIIEKIAPGVFGGPFYAFYRTAKPIWYKDSYASHEPFKEPRVLNETECVNIYGGNMFFRRELLKKSGGFEPSLGMSGRKVAYGEETELMKLISTKMPHEIIYYDPSLYLYHLVQEKKMSLFWIARQRFFQGKYVYRAIYRDPSISVTKGQLFKEVIKALINITHNITYGSIKRDRKQYPYVQNYFYEYTSENIARLGRICEQYKQIAKRKQLFR